MLEFVNELLDSQDNIIDQLKLLKENKNHKEVKKYMRALVKQNNSPYFKYCIDKYYFNKEVEEVKPTAKNLNVTLYKIYFPSLLKKQENKKIIKYKKAIKKAKKGDKVKIFDGPFGGMTGTVKAFDIDNLKLVITIELFETKYDIEYENEFEIIKEDKHAKKN